MVACENSLTIHNKSVKFNFLNCFIKLFYLYLRLWVVACKSLDTREKSTWVIPKVVAVAYRSSLLQELFITTFKSQFKQSCSLTRGKLQLLFVWNFNIPLGALDLILCLEGVGNLMFAWARWGISTGNVNFNLILVRWQHESIDATLLVVRWRISLQVKT